jgi:hypothetical protein
MKDLYHNVLPTRALTIQTISGSPLASGDVDLKGFEAAQVLVDFGDIAEMGASPVGNAAIAVKLEHADDDGSSAPGAYVDATEADVVGPASVSAGVVASTSSDLVPIRFGYVGGKRFIRVTLTPTDLSVGGPVGIWVEKAHARHAPAA